jgi:hypothetical protein
MKRKLFSDSEGKTLMSTKASMQPDAYGQLRSALADALRSHELLAEYVTELALHRNEEDIFRRLAFRAANSAEANAGSAIASGLPELYEAMSIEAKNELRQWWHEEIRREAYQHEDLRKRLSWRYLI